MRIIEQQEKQEYVMRCPVCKTVFAYDDQDVEKVGDKVYCPVCEERLTATYQTKLVETEVEERFVFPDSFYHFGSDESNLTYILSDEETQQFIDEIKSREKQLNPGEFSMISTGDTIVIGLKYEDSFVIDVCKNYWEDSIDYGD